MAVPSAVVAVTITAFALAAESVTVKLSVFWPTSPSVTETSLIDRLGASSLSVMVMVLEDGVPNVPEAVGALRLTVKVSSVSSRVSAVIGTLKSMLPPLPASKFSMPVVVA